MAQYTVRGKAETAIYIPNLRQFSGGSYLFDVTVNLNTPDSCTESTLAFLEKEFKRICDQLDHATLISESQLKQFEKLSERYCVVNSTTISDVTVTQTIYNLISDFLDKNQITNVTLIGVTSYLGNRQVHIDQENENLIINQSEGIFNS